VKWHSVRSKHEALVGTYASSDVVGRCPVTDPAVFLGRKVGAEILGHDGDAHLGYSEGRQRQKTRKVVRFLSVFTCP
jgi:hypothetical protein